MREVTMKIEPWEMTVPFRITGHIFTAANVLRVSIREDSHVGHGEAAGVYYINEDAASMLEQAQSVQQALEQGADRNQLQQLLPAGGARNAIDCALWDLEAKQRSQRVWDLIDMPAKPLTTFETIGIDTVEAMAEQAKKLKSSNIKVKLNNEAPLERVRAIRNARPEALIIVDVNQGWSMAELVQYAPLFHELDIAMIEQPLPRGEDDELSGYQSPITLCADESCLDSSEFAHTLGRYQMINIKLDKTGGLTEALKLADLARQHNMELMVGNMLGTSLAMAPGFVIGQLCRFVDLDGPLYLKNDREYALDYNLGVVNPPVVELWG